MFDPSGNPVESLLSNLRDGLCELRSRREERRHRVGDGAPPSTPAHPANVGATASSPGSTNVHAAEPMGRSTTGLNPRGFVAVEGRLVPFFGELACNVTPAAAAPGPTPGEPTPQQAATPPRSPPPPVPTPPSSPTFEAKQDAASPRPSKPGALNLPLPTPPARLGLASTPSQGTVAGEPTPIPAPAKHAPTERGELTPTRDDSRIETLLARHSDAEAERLEKVHAEHRALLATLLSEHRAMLQDQADANAARQDNVISDLLTEHRTEFSSILNPLIEHLHQLRDQQRTHAELLAAAAREFPVSTSSDIAVLRDVLAEQARFQHKAQQEMTENLDTLAVVVRNMGQTVGLLAVATYEGKREKPAVLLPPVITPTPRPSPPPVSTLTETTMKPPTPAPRATPPQRDTAVDTEPAPRPSQAISAERRHETTTARSRVDELVCDYEDDDDLQDVHDPDAPPPRSRLSPITPIEADDEAEPANA
jgi:hypothetical protein